MEEKLEMLIRQNEELREKNKVLEIENNFLKNENDYLKCTIRELIKKEGKKDE